MVKVVLDGLFLVTCIKHFLTMHLRRHKQHDATQSLGIPSERGAWAHRESC